MLELVEEHRCFGGTQRTYRHGSELIGHQMRVSVFLADEARSRSVPALYFAIVTIPDLFSGPFTNQED
jgi:S-formylglutathione hydrolase